VIATVLPFFFVELSLAEPVPDSSGGTCIKNWDFGKIKPKLRTIFEVAPMADNRTMEELLQAPTKGYGEAIIIPKINADHFEIKTNLLQLVQAIPYHSFKRENPHTHIRVAKDVVVKVGKFHFSTDFVVVDFKADPRVPFILGRSFLRTGRALIEVYGEEITLWVNEESVTFNLNQTTRYSYTYDDMLVNRIDVIDVAREEYAQEMLGFSSNFLGGNPTSTCEPLISNSFPSITPFEGSDFILEEIEVYLKDQLISLEIDHADCDPEGDICLIEKLLNDDPF
nr:reverse transcriptase domain-containing protein [Tanacetum cinerariifolium]